MNDNPYSATTKADPGFESTGTKRILKRVNPVQLAKFLGLLYALLGLIFAPFFLLAALFGPKGAGMGLVMVILIPVLYGIAGVISGLLGGWIYNVVAKIIGGIEVEVV